MNSKSSSTRMESGGEVVGLGIKSRLQTWSERSAKMNSNFHFYRNLLIIKFDQHASIALKEALFYKALETELEVVPE